MFNQNGASRQPRYIAFFKNKAYVASFDGTVSRIDTATMTVDSIVTVGANPDGICVANNKLYVSNSGGLNAPNYGNTVSVIDINTFTQIKQIQVGLNPSKILADSEGDVFLCSLGNYGNVPYTFQMINSQTDQLAQTFSNINALDFTIHNDTAYIYNCDYQNNTNWIKVFDCKTQTIVSQSFITDGTTLQTPYGINVNPQNGDVYITDAGSFVTSGDLYWFSSKGKLKGKLANVGLNPSSIVFIQN
jgi:YVTN family beta-propeller protein